MPAFETTNWQIPKYPDNCGILISRCYHGHIHHIPLTTEIYSLWDEFLPLRLVPETRKTSEECSIPSWIWCFTTNWLSPRPLNVATWMNVESCLDGRWKSRPIAASILSNSLTYPGDACRRCIIFLTCKLSSLQTNANTVLFESMALAL
jgi:hypothetical protein